MKNVHTCIYLYKIVKSLNNVRPELTTIADILWIYVFLLSLQIIV
jgi:hypothetical protein